MDFYIDPKPEKDTVRQGLVIGAVNPTIQSQDEPIRLLVVDDQQHARSAWDDIMSTFQFQSLIDDPLSAIRELGIKDIGLNDVDPADRAKWTEAYSQYQALRAERVSEEGKLVRKGRHGERT